MSRHCTQCWITLTHKLGKVGEKLVCGSRCLYRQWFSRYHSYPIWSASSLVAAISKIGACCCPDFRSALICGWWKWLAPLNWWIFSLSLRLSPGPAKALERSLLHWNWGHPRRLHCIKLESPIRARQPNTKPITCLSQISAPNQTI